MLGQPCGFQVSGAAYTVTELSTSATVPSQTTAIDARTKQLPLLYINKYKMSGAQYAAAGGGGFEQQMGPGGYGGAYGGY